MRRSVQANERLAAGRAGGSHPATAGSGRGRLISVTGHVNGARFSVPPLSVPSLSVPSLSVPSLSVQRSVCQVCELQCVSDRSRSISFLQP